MLAVNCSEREDLALAEQFKTEVDSIFTSRERVNSRGLLREPFGADLGAKAEVRLLIGV